MDVLHFFLHIPFCGETLYVVTPHILHLLVTFNLQIVTDADKIR